MRQPGESSIVKALALAAALAFGLVPTARAEQSVAKISWPELDKAGKLVEGRVVPADGKMTFASLRVENTGSQPRSAPLAVFEKPAVTATRYAVRGQIRYEAMAGTGYLEMWSFFPGGGHYFSRTLAPSGPMGSLTGSSPWRPFVLPFDTNGQAVPERLTVSLVFGGRGTAFVGPLELVQYSGTESAFTPAGAWWGDREGGMLGGALGGFFGVCGALVGALAALGRARGAVLAMLSLMIAVGLAALVAGVVAVSMRQPYPVFYPLLLTGFVGTLVPALLSGHIRKRYEELELRRMSAFDAPGVPR